MIPYDEIEQLIYLYDQIPVDLFEAFGIPHDPSHDGLRCVYLRDQLIYYEKYDENAPKSPIRFKDIMAAIQPDVFPEYIFTIDCWRMNAVGKYQTVEEFRAKLKSIPPTPDEYRLIIQDTYGAVIWAQHVKDICGIHFDEKEALALTRGYSKGEKAAIEKMAKAGILNLIKDRQLFDQLTDPSFYQAKPFYEVITDLIEANGW